MIRAALVLALLAVPAAAQTAPGVAEGCVTCHGPRGAGSGSVPPLAGRDAADLATAMAAFRANERPATIMNRIVRGYTEAEVAAAVTYFSGLR
ncbi:c-type cytochrome [Muricoccus radiodurans]|uniref:c-type cytochrome n=1 Tax=Muricoccus radiodurans TaxID=2231721 RepID=UPI003CED42C0